MEGPSQDTLRPEELFEQAAVLGEESEEFLS